MERMEGRDAADVDKARAGDTEAFRALVERHSHALFRLAYRMTRNEQDAEDIVQDAFLKAYRGLTQFESRANFGSWLYRIAANCAYDLLRTRSRREEQPLEQEHADGELEALALVAEDPGPDRLLHGAEVRRRLAVALARLSTLERSAFVLRHFEEMSIGEIGAALGLDTNATKQSIFRAVRKMRLALAPVVAFPATARARE